MSKQKRKRSLRKKKDIVPSDLEIFIREGQYEFWLAHGANYLASSLEEGMWRPIFPIYQGMRYSQLEITTEVRTLFQDAEGITFLGRVLLDWCRQKPEGVYSFYQTLIEKASSPEVIQGPHAEVVWKAFQALHRVRA